METMNAPTSRVNHDPHTQLRQLYQSLLTRQERFDEFKQLLALYPVEEVTDDDEPPYAADIRGRLNRRISEWIAQPFMGLSVTQVTQWRAIVVEERINVCLSPWKESNAY
jgi:hypothetical protein